MTYRPDQPLVVQSDRTVLLETAHPRFREARNLLATFAELERSPEHIHTWRISPLSLWNSAAAKHEAEGIIALLGEYSKYPLPSNVEHEIRHWMERWGALKLVAHDDGYALESSTPGLLREILAARPIQRYVRETLGRTRALIDPAFRGHLKMELIRIGWPVEDLAGYRDGAPFSFALRDATRSGNPFGLRAYQLQAVEAFTAGGGAAGGAGVIVLPCGAGKTIVGMAAIREVGRKTLILTTNIVAARQWRDELLDKTTISPEEIGEY